MLVPHKMSILSVNSLIIGHKRPTENRKVGGSIPSLATSRSFAIQILSVSAFLLSQVLITPFRSKCCQCLRARDRSPDSVLNEYLQVS